MAEEKPELPVFIDIDTFKEATAWFLRCPLCDKILDESGCTVASEDDDTFVVRCKRWLKKTKNQK